jgi:hypothetical protein
MVTTHTTPDSEIVHAVETAHRIEKLPLNDARDLTSNWLLSRRLSRAVNELNGLVLEGPHRRLAYRALAKLGFDA